MNLPLGLPIDGYLLLHIYKLIRTQTVYPHEQVMANPDVCGEVPDYSTVDRFLRDLLGQSPASLWADLLQEVGWKTLLEKEICSPELFF